WRMSLQKSLGQGELRSAMCGCQIFISGDTTSPRNSQSARLYVAKVEFVALAAGTAEVTGVVGNVVIDGADSSVAFEETAVLAGAGTMVLSTSRRRRLGTGTRVQAPRLGAERNGSTASAMLPMEVVEPRIAPMAVIERLQSVRRELQDGYGGVLGDANADDRFDIADVTYLQQRAALVAVTGTTAFQVAQWDTLLRGPGRAYINSTNPVPAVAQKAEPYVPDITDIKFLRAVNAGQERFLRGLTITLPSVENGQQLVLAAEVLNKDGTVATAGVGGAPDQTRVRYELLSSTDDFLLAANAAVESQEPANRSYVVTATAPTAGSAGRTFVATLLGGGPDGAFSSLEGGLGDRGRELQVGILLETAPADGIFYQNEPNSLRQQALYKSMVYPYG
ncbi:hypothetical protein CYMTET_29812, partial [Cymbomonas tetramitiformis]